MKPSFSSFHILLSLFIPALLLAQTEDPPHTELDWYTIETNHFFVHYHESAARSAGAIAQISETIYGPITELYQHQPDQKVHFVVRDYDDYSNGAAYFYDNKIEIWAPAMDFELRGIHPWLWNVVTHEFTHLVQIQTAMKLGRKIPAIYFQWFGYEAERRPDVLYGFPNILVSYPLSAFVVPSWFAEGTAQYNHPDLHFDYWDSHRDMILRMYLIDGNQLGWEEMAVFGKTSLGNESAYNAGFSIVQYISERYGADTLRLISRALGSIQRLTIDGAIEAVLGISGEELYKQWRESKEANYLRVKERIEPHRVEGSALEQEGFGNFYPQFSPDGSMIAYVSNKGRDYFSQSALYIYDVKSQSSSKIVDGVRSTVSFSPDGRYLYYSKVSSQNPHWSRVYDIYRYDRVSKEEVRLTRGQRAISPSVSPDGKKIVFAFGSDGTMNIGICDSSGRNVVSITQFNNGEQVYTPVWSPDGLSIAAGYSVGDKQNVILLSREGSNVRTITSQGDSRNPVFSRDGSVLYYSSDRTGIFNIYGLSLAGGGTSQVTNVLGGAFLPSVDGEGNVVYASYTSSGYKIALLPSKERPIVEVDQATQEFTPFQPANSTTIGDSAKTVNGEKGHSYRNKFTSLTLIPMIRVDNYNRKNKGIDIVKPGLYFTSSDILDKLSLFGGAALNRKLERDLFVMFEFRDRLPLLYSLGLEPVVSLELYNITRKTTVAFTLDPSPVLVEPEVTFSLFEVDVAFRHRIVDERTTLRLWYALSRYNRDIAAFVIPNPPVSLVPASRSTYLIGNVFAAEVRHKNILPGVESEINPVGRSLMVRYAYESNKFNLLGDYAIEDGVYVPVYTRVLFHRLEMQWDEHLSSLLDHHTINVSVRGAGVLGKTVDNFFDFYAGGVLGMKGYPFYALGGNTVATAGIAYRFPLVRSINFRFLQFYFTKLYASVFGDLGNAWIGSPRSGGIWKKDAGFELRLEAFSFYAYPTRFFFSGSYGFDRFERIFSETRVTYGKEWRFYFGVLFGFEINDITRLRGL